jgi:hypothetical protein
MKTDPREARGDLSRTGPLAAKRAARQDVLRAARFVSGFNPLNRTGLHGSGSLHELKRLEFIEQFVRVDGLE